jgi:hypothetical protein
MTMAQTSFEVDAATLAAIAELKDRFGVKTNAQVIRKALALARVAAQNADSDNALTIVAPNSEHKKILLAGWIVAWPASFIGVNGMCDDIISLGSRAADISVREVTSNYTRSQTISLNTEADKDQPLSVNEHIVRRREWSRQIISLTTMLSMLLIVVLPFLTLLTTPNRDFNDLKELLHILIPPIIGIVGAVMGFYFGERNMG